MQDQDRRSIVLVGMPGTRRYEVGKALADRLGFHFMENLPESLSPESDIYNKVYVPNDIRDVDAGIIDLLRSKSLFIFLDMSVTADEYGDDVDDMQRLYISSRPYFERCCHTTVICQQKKFDVEAVVDVIEKVWEKMKKTK